MPYLRVLIQVSLSVLLRVFLFRLSFRVPWLVKTLHIEKLIIFLLLLVLDSTWRCCFRTKDLFLATVCSERWPFDMMDWDFVGGRRHALLHVALQLILMFAFIVSLITLTSSRRLSFLLPSNIFNRYSRANAKRASLGPS